MKAIFVGTLCGGFRIDSVVDAATAEDLVIARMANGELAEALEVKSPTDLAKTVKSDSDGLNFIVFGKSLGGGFEVYGPFLDADVADDFGETYRGDDGEWERFEVASQAG